MTTAGSPSAGTQQKLVWGLTSCCPSPLSMAQVVGRKTLVDVPTSEDPKNWIASSWIADALASSCRTLQAHQSSVASYRQNPGGTTLLPVSDPPQHAKYKKVPCVYGLFTLTSLQQLGRWHSLVWMVCHDCWLGDIVKTLPLQNLTDTWYVP